VATVTTHRPVEGFDPQRLGQFMTRVLGDMSGAMIGLMGIIGDRLGLFRLLVSGPSTPEELAERASVDHRYVRDWLNALTCAGYLEHDPASGCYALPAEHAMVLAAEGAPTFLGGGYEQLAGFAGALDRVIGAMSDGKGVPQADYGPALHSGMERMSASWFDHQLVQQWVANVPGLARCLEVGATVADVGCGPGRALIALARAFPSTSLVGYDLFAPALTRAEANIAQAGLSGRIRLVHRDAAAGLDGPFELITTFDMLHDATRPEAIAAAVHRALAEDGIWLVAELARGESVDDNLGHPGAILYATSVLFCTPTSIAGGGQGLGSMGMPGSAVRALCFDAGFTSVEALSLDNPFNVVYAARR
jgi:Rv2258c-like winged HTH domain/Methyltransferase domain